MSIKKVDQQIPEYVNVRLSHNRVKRELEERFEPPPEHPFHVRNDVKGNENRTQKDRHGGRYIAKGNHAEHGSLGDNHTQKRCDITEDFDDVKGQGESWRFHAPVEIIQAIPDLLDKG